MISSDARQRDRAARVPRDTLEDVLRRGALCVPVEWDAAPHVSGAPPDYYIDPDTGKPAGIVPILSEMLAKDLRVRTEYVEVPFAGQIDALLRREVDVLLKHCNTPDRALLVDFGERLMCFQTVVVVSRASPFERPEDLNRSGVAVATTEGSSCRHAIARHFPRAAVVERPYSCARQALGTGELQAFVTDAVTKVSMSLYPDQRVLRDERGAVVTLARECGHAAVYPGDRRFLTWLNNWISYWRTQGPLAHWCETWWRRWFVE